MVDEDLIGRGEGDPDYWGNPAQMKSEGKTVPGRIGNLYELPPQDGDEIQQRDKDVRSEINESLIKE